MTEPAKHLLGGWCSLVFAAVALIAAGSASAGDTQADSDQDWLTALRMPGPDHERLNALIGEWTMTVRYWGHPEDEAVELTGSATSQWTLDGRFVEERAENGTSQGTRYESIGYLGYDRQAKLYERFWMTNSSTAISSERGRYDPDENVIRMEGSEVAPGSGAVILTASELKIESPSRHVVTAYATGADGVRWKQLEIVYTKK